MVRLILAAVALVIATGFAGADRTKITISKAVAASFEGYKGALTAIGTGAYAITEDGQGGAGAGCATAHCAGGSRAKDAAILRCERANPGRKCIIFAEGRDPVMEYQVGE